MRCDDQGSERQTDRLDEDRQRNGLRIGNGRCGGGSCRCGCRRRCGPACWRGRQLAGHSASTRRNRHGIAGPEEMSAANEGKHLHRTIYHSKKAEKTMATAPSPTTGAHQALGLIETRGYIATVSASDAMLKAANVNLV